MANESIGKIIIGDWNIKTAAAVLTGAAGFGFLMVYGSITVFTNTQLTLAMIIPVIIGGLFGPLPAFAALFLGNILADTLFGEGYWFDWSLGNGVLGFFIGAMPLYGVKIRAGIFKLRHALIYAVVAVVGNTIAFGIVTPLCTTLIYESDLEVTFVQTFAAGLSNTLVLVIAGIPVLIILARIFAELKPPEPDAAPLK
jgi:energy-coupling factor transport system substrate-specific component